MNIVKDYFQLSFVVNIYSNSTKKFNIFMKTRIRFI
jgi:hypothetical protein